MRFQISILYLLAKPLEWPGGYVPAKEPLGIICFVPPGKMGRRLSNCTGRLVNQVDGPQFASSSRNQLTFVQVLGFAMIVGSRVVHAVAGSITVLKLPNYCINLEVLGIQVGEQGSDPIVIEHLVGSLKTS